MKYKRDISQSVNNNKNSSGDNPDDKFKCGKCGYTHARKNCPAFNKQCNSCKNYNHF